MKMIADLHIHSRYSMATSKDGNPENLDLWARKKGISLIGTGDFTHPAWRGELLEKLIPEWSGGEYISMAQAEEMFGVDLTGLKEFSLSSYNNLFSLKKCFALFAMMQRTKDADGNREFYTENDSLHITLCGGDSDRIQIAVNINDMPQSLEKADALLAKAGIQKSLSDKKLLHCLQSAEGMVTVGDAPEVQMPDSLLNQDVVEKISTVRTILQELFGE